MLCIGLISRLQFLLFSSARGPGRVYTKEGTIQLPDSDQSTVERRIHRREVHGTLIAATPACMRGARSSYQVNIGVRTRGGLE